MLIKHFFNMFYKLYLELSKLVYNYIEALNYIIKYFSKLIIILIFFEILLALLIGLNGSICVTSGIGYLIFFNSLAATNANSA